MWLIWKNYIIPSLEAFLLLELMIEGKDVVKWSLIVFCLGVSVLMATWLPAQLY